MEIKDIASIARYIGDGVYLVPKEYDGYHVWIITSDGYEVTNKIALDPQTLATLVKELTS